MQGAHFDDSHSQFDKLTALSNVDRWLVFAGSRETTALEARK
jgi:hypothetical protein